MSRFRDRNPLPFIPSKAGIQARARRISQLAARPLDSRLRENERAVGRRIVVNWVLEHTAKRARGVAAIEFALILPTALLLLLGGTDLALWLQAWFRLERTASETADIVARAQTLSAADFTAAGSGYFAVAQQIAAPLVVAGSGGATIISGIVNSGSTTTIAWQEVNTTNPAYVSRIGAVGQAPVLPTGYTVPTGQTVIAAEIFNGNHIWYFSLPLRGTTGSAPVYVSAFYRPRSADLSALQ